MSRHGHSHDDEDFENHQDSSFSPDPASFSPDPSFIPPPGMANGEFIPNPTSDPLLSANQGALGGGFTSVGSFTPSSRFSFTPVLQAQVNPAGVSTSVMDQDAHMFAAAPSSANDPALGSATGKNTTVIIASSVAGAVVAIALAVGLFMYVRKRKRNAAVNAVWDKEASYKSHTAFPSALPPLPPIPLSTTSHHSGARTPTTPRSAAHMSAYHQRLQKTMSVYPRPDSILSTHSDASLAPNVLGMVQGGGGGFGSSWKQRTVFDADEMSQYTQDDDVVVAESDGGWEETEHVGALHGSGNRRPSAAFDGVSWPRRGRVNTGTEVFGMM